MGDRLGRPEGAVGFLFFYDLCQNCARFSSRSRSLLARSRAPSGRRATPCVLVPSRGTAPSKNCVHFSICACHPCAGAMLIFSVSFQFYRMILERNPKCKRNTSWYTDPPACLQAIAGALASSVAWSDHGRVRAKFCVSIPNEPPRSEHILCARMFAETIRAVLPDCDGDIRCAPCVVLPHATV